MLDEERFPIKSPTKAQRAYANDLVRQLQEAGVYEAGRYARAVDRCYNRIDMSRFISEMKELVEEEKDSIGRYRQPRGCKDC